LQALYIKHKNPYKERAMTLKPRASIFDIQPYKGGLSKAAPGQRVIKLSSNETPLGTSPKAIEAFKNSADKLYRYPDGSAAELKQAIAEVYKLNPDQIVCGAGSDELIAFLCLAYAGEGTEVIYTEHGFLMYKIYAMAGGAKPVCVPEKNLKTDVDSILNGVTAKTRIVFVANPNNPTGSYISKAEILRLRKGLRDDILLVLDGAYAEYVSEGDYSAGQDIVDMGENTVMLRTFSKIYGLAALRVGWGYFPLAMADVVNRIRGPFNISAPAIAAASAAVRDIEFTKKTKEFNDCALKFMHEQLDALGLAPVPSVGNFILAKFKDEKTAAAANDYLMSKGIIIRMVANYGLDEYLRISIGLEEDNEAVIKALKEFLA
jgi:histidinol-phosphate aminotransferase